MASEGRPNILFVFPEDWGLFAGAYAPHDGTQSLNALLQTPHFDRRAAEGVLFLNARTPAPGCNPCRSSLFSGRCFWQTGLGAIEQGTAWDTSIPTWPLELEKSGYFLGYTYEGDYGKTNARVGGDRTAYNAAGKCFGDFSRWVTRQAPRLGGVAAAREALLDEVRANFRAFLDTSARVPRQPFCYLWGPTTTHRGAGWQRCSGLDLWGIDPEHLKGRLPAFLPDVPEVREDVANYLGQVCAMDLGLGVLLTESGARDELDSTLIVVTGDHGMPGMPRAKANLYDFGSQVALSVRWPGIIPGGRVVDDFVNIMDLAPTLCQAGSIDIPKGMAARSLMPILTSTSAGQVEVARDYAVGRLERHVCISRADFSGYPMRSIRTRDFLYIVNFAPERWPTGDPHGLENLSADVGDIEDLARETMVVFPDFDASPTKAWLIKHRGDAGVAPMFQIAFGRRPAEELYDMSKDADCMRNLAGEDAYTSQQASLRRRLMEVLAAQGDPRVIEEPCRFEFGQCVAVLDKYTSEKGKAFMQGLQQRRSSWQTASSKL
mmetsp:Transcript_98493/g.257288  ORF Transcript_98493/g.257288 Transcript_98493/m.257288 type:complete len:547 (+) Transcript_98493:92-1732(+)